MIHIAEQVFMKVDEVAAELGVSNSYAYKLIRELNKELKYEREIDSGNQMKKTIKRLNEEKDSQSGIVAKFYALCRGFGEEYIESQAMGILEREAMERQQKKARPQAT